MTYRNNAYAFVGLLDTIAGSWRAKLYMEDDMPSNTNNDDGAPKKKYVSSFFD